MIIPGVIQQQRGFFAKFPRIGLFGVRLRWVGWNSIIWPMSTSLAVSILVANLIRFVAVELKFVPWVGMLSAVAEFFGALAAVGRTSAVALGVIVAAIFAGLTAGWFYWVAWRADSRILFAALKAGAVSGFVVWSMVATPETLPLLSLLPFTVLLEILLASKSRQFRILRYASQLNREIPVLFAQIASKTKRIQSRDDSGVETEISQVAAKRAMLEHMARWPWFNIDTELASTEQTVFASPARTLVEFEEILDQITANWPWAYKMELVPVDRDSIDGAHVAIWRVYWDMDFPSEKLPQPKWFYPTVLRLSTMAQRALPGLDKFATRSSS